MIDVQINADNFLHEIERLGDQAIDLPLAQIAEMMIENVRSHDIPVRTGALYNSIEANIVGNEISVGSPLDYAVYVDQGTRYQDAQPFMFVDDWLEESIENLICDSMGLKEG